MTQILVTLNEDATTLHVRKAIELLRGVVSTTVLKTKDESNKKTLRQQAYVKESLERAFDEMKQARREEVWWPADTSDGNAAETAFRVSFDLSYTLNTHENRFTKPFMAIFCAKLGKTHEKAPDMTEKRSPGVQVLN